VLSLRVMDSAGQSYQPQYWSNVRRWRLKSFTATRRRLHIERGSKQPDTYKVSWEIFKRLSNTAPNLRAPGWDEWRQPRAGNPYSEFNTRQRNGALVPTETAAGLHDGCPFEKRRTSFRKLPLTRNRSSSLCTSRRISRPASAAHADAFQGATAPRPRDNDPTYHETGMDTIASLPVCPASGKWTTSSVNVFRHARLQDMVEHIIDTLSPRPTR